MARAPRHGVYDDLEPGNNLSFRALGARVHQLPRPRALGPHDVGLHAREHVGHQRRPAARLVEDESRRRRHLDAALTQRPLLVVIQDRNKKIKKNKRHVRAVNAFVYSFLVFRPTTTKNDTIPGGDTTKKKGKKNNRITKG